MIVNELIESLRPHFRTLEDAHLEITALLVASPAPTRRPSMQESVEALKRAAASDDEEVVEIPPEGLHWSPTGAAPLDDEEEIPEALSPKRGRPPGKKIDVGSLKLEPFVEAMGGDVKPKKTFPLKPCCGSKGPRHKSECAYGLGRMPPAAASDDQADLKDLHAWECIECGKIVESREEELTAPCTACGGVLVQKF